MLPLAPVRLFDCGHDPVANAFGVALNHFGLAERTMEILHDIIFSVAGVMSDMHVRESTVCLEDTEDRRVLITDEVVKMRWTRALLSTTWWTTRWSAVLMQQ